MIKVYEDFDLSTVGRYQSVLEAEGIRTHLKNLYTSSVLGEIPFVEAIPQLWVIDEADLARARALLEKLQHQHEEGQPDWICRNCDAVVEAVFDRCWKCETDRPAPEPEES